MTRLTYLMALKVQLGTGAAADSRYDSARYGQAGYVSPDDPWVDVTCDSLMVRTWRGGDLQPGIVWRAMADGAVGLSGWPAIACRWRDGPTA